MVEFMACLNGRNNGASMVKDTRLEPMLYKASRSCWRKRKFESVSDAKRFFKRRQKRLHDPTRQYAYLCSVCGGAHLTKIPIRNGDII